MKKLADFLVDKRKYIFIVFIVLTVFSLYLMTRVNVNYDMAKYLPADSEMKKGLNKMNAEFGEEEVSTLRLMFKGLDNGEKEEILSYLKELKNVDSVEEFTDESGKYELYVISMPCDTHSKESKKLFRTVKKHFKDYKTWTSGTISEANIPTLSNFMKCLAIFLLSVILLAMCNS